MVSDTPKVVAAACDGACSGNPGPGGWGCLLRFDDGSVQEFGGADANTTNKQRNIITESHFQITRLSSG